MLSRMFLCNYTDVFRIAYKHDGDYCYFADADISISLSSFSMKTKLITLVIFTCCFNLSFGQDYWHIFNASDEVWSTQAGNGRIWVNAGSGLSAVSTDDLSVTRFHSNNSPIYYHTPQLLVEDPEGRIWMTGDSALLRFDGQNLEELDSLGGFPVYSINATLKGPGDKIWLLGKFGEERLLVYDNETFTPIPSHDSLAIFHYFNDLAVDTAGHVWTILSLTTVENFLYEYDGTDWIYHDLSGFQTTQKAHHNDYIADQAGNVYCYLRNPVDSNLIRWDGTQWHKMNIPLTGGFFNLYVDPTNNLWVQQTNEILLKWDGQIWQQFNLTDDGLPKGYPKDLEVDAEGRLWVVYLPNPSSAPTLLYVQVNGHFQPVDLSNSPLLSNSVESLTLDQWNRKWIDTEQGLQLFDGATWTNFGLPDYTWAFGAIDACPDGTLYGRNANIPFAPSITRFTAAGFEKIDITDPDGNPYKYVWDLAAGNECQAVIAVNGPQVLIYGENGLTYSDTLMYGESWHPFEYSEHIMEVAAGPNGIFWALGGALHRYENGMWERIDDAQGGSVFGTLGLYLHVDQNNVAYVQRQGDPDTLFRYDGVNWEKILLPEQYGYLRLAVDSKGTIWGARSSLWKYLGNDAWEEFNIYNSPLPTTIINDLEVDAFDNLWLTTNKGLVVFNENGLESFGTITAVSNVAATATLDVFPNPSDNHLTIASGRHIGEYRLRLFDQQGRLVQAQQGFAEQSVNMPLKAVAPGVYFLQMTTETWTATSVVVRK